MKKLIVMFILFTLVAGCSTTQPNKTTVCNLEEGNMSIELSVVSSGEEIKSHTARTTLDFTTLDKRKEDVLNLIEDSKNKYGEIEGYTFDATYNEPILVETIIADYSKLSKDDLEEGYDQLGDLLESLKSQGFTCSE